MLDMVTFQRAYAKIVGPDWTYYMTKPDIVLGRGPDNVDVVLSGGLCVSRKHAMIRFSPELQAFELTCLGKNGLLVNGVYVGKGSTPVILRSQADIIFGKADPMVMSFLLPKRDVEIEYKQRVRKAHSPILDLVGQALVFKGPMTGPALREEIKNVQTRQLETISSDDEIDSAIRHVVLSNQHIFFVISAYDAEQQAAAVGEAIKSVTHASFDVRGEHRQRFIAFGAAKK